MARLPSVLDPGDPSGWVRHSVHRWLAVQAAFALRPEEARRVLLTNSGPEALLRCAPGARLPESEVHRRARKLARIGARQAADDIGHMAGVALGHDYLIHTVAKGSNLGRRKRPKGLGAKEPHRPTFLPKHSDRGQADLAEMP